MDHIRKNERGMTLLELMAAVVILVLVAIPFTSIGTTVYRWYKEDEQKNRAVLIAEQRIQEVISYLNGIGWASNEGTEPIIQAEPNNLQTVVTLSPHPITLDANGNPPSVLQLVNVKVEVIGPDLEQPSKSKTLTTLETTIRKKTAAGGTS